MRGHVVRSFGSVPVTQVIFWRQTLEVVGQVQDHVGIGILLYDE